MRSDEIVLLLKEIRDLLVEQREQHDEQPAHRVAARLDRIPPKGQTRAA